MISKNSYTELVEQNKSKVKVTLSLEERMRILANLMIDKILEDYRKGQLKFINNSGKVIMEHKK